MNVLQIGKYYEPHLGGIENVMYSMCHFLKKNHLVTALVYNKSLKSESFNDKGVKVFKVGIICRLRSQPIPLGLSKKIEELSIEADIIHIHSPNPIAELQYLLINPKKKLIVTYHSDVTRQKILLNFYKPIIIKLLERSDVIIATSKQYAEHSPILSKYLNKIKVVPLGLEPSIYLKYDKKTVKSIKKKYGPNIVLFVGRLVAFKGVKYAIRAMEDCSDTNLLIVGSGPEEKKLKLLTKRLKLTNIQFIGQISDKKELVNYLHACDIFVFPSISRNESFGLSQLEAMACGKPVIGTKLESGTCYVNQHNKTGLIVAPKNPEAISISIKDLIRNVKKRRKFGLNAKKRFLKYFTLNQALRKTEDVYNEVLVD